jgi:hypothetical protein
MFIPNKRVFSLLALKFLIKIQMFSYKLLNSIRSNQIYRKVMFRSKNTVMSQSRGDVPGWVLVVLMTTALVTGIWSIAAPKLTAILRNSLDAMSGIK